MFIEKYTDFSVIFFCLDLFILLFIKLVDLVLVLPPIHNPRLLVEDAERPKLS
jgi:hypothetical protein